MGRFRRYTIVRITTYVYSAFGDERGRLPERVVTPVSHHFTYGRALALCALLQPTPNVRYEVRGPNGRTTRPV